LPNETAKHSSWSVCSPETVGDYTAVGYFFARRLHQDLKVPVGLVSSNWGGTIIEAWISGDSLKTHPDFKARVEKMQVAAKDPEQAKSLARKIDAWTKAYSEMQKTPAENYQGVAVDDSSWGTQKLPGYWEQQGFKDIDGVAWYRRKVTIPDQWKGKALELSLGVIDDADVTWVNGTKVGENGRWDAKRLYRVPASLVNTNELSIAVKVTDGNLGGGIVGDADKLSIGPVGETPISLAGEWKFTLEPATEKVGPRPKGVGTNQNQPMVLHNAMINPLIPFSARGTIWYQGESNGGRGRQYRTLMPLLVNDWRRAWGNDMSFYWVQLANFQAPREQPYDSQWAELREAQSMTLSLPKTGQAVIIDIGEARDIHPRNKQDVGKRLALIALAKDYGKDVKYSGPMYKSMLVEGERIKIQFDFAEGLAVKDGGELKRFEICGEDQTFYWADAQIEGQDVVVSSSKVKSPVAVRYAWAENPEGCNLTNETGLPASPFRTDDWERRE
jgi:sialate O-acetylesterase